jgi:hypothetical protein
MKQKTPTPMTPGAVGPVSANPYSHDPTGAMGGAFFASQCSGCEGQLGHKDGTGSIGLLELI